MTTIFDLHMPSSPPQAMATAVAVTELHEQFFMMEERLTLDEEGLMAREAGKGPSRGFRPTRPT
jgi:hypothetical protein